LHQKLDFNIDEAMKKNSFSIFGLHCHRLTVHTMAVVIPVPKIKRILRVSIFLEI